MEENLLIPQSILEAADRVRLDLLPEKSKVCYEKEYQQFCQWRDKEQIQGAGESILLAYFSKLPNDYSASSLWPKYSMLRVCLELKERVEIDKYGSLIRFIKKKNVGYRAKKSKVLTRKQVDEFVRTAPDEVFLMMKVAFLIGIGGACRSNELAKMLMDDVEILESKLVVTIPDSKTHKKRFFAVLSEGDVQAVDLFKKYIALRPLHVTHRRLFISYRNGKCTVQPCGIHLFSKISEKIATYLKLENPTMFTGHCVRRYSATFLVDAGGDILDLQELGGWESSKVARGYLEENLTKKVSIAHKIQSGHASVSSVSSATKESINLGTITCGEPSGINKVAKDPSMKIKDTSNISIHFSDCQNFQIDIYK